MNEKRGNYRSTVRVPMKIRHKSFGTLDVNSRDVSVGGAYALIEQTEPLPHTGSIINVQVLGGLGIRNEINAEVIRVEKNGIGLRFLYPDYIRERLH
ncbi:MAG TPA: PilZ domain-containing protein [Gammaproteobacteria bacterium]|jgi:hypothetical protein